MTQSPDFAALIGSRICHDLISPLGAIGNGVELMGMTGIAQTPEMALISESVENANARIRFFRIAYGAAADDHVVSRTEVTSVLGAAARGGRLSYVWEPREDQPRRDVRAAFLALQCLETAMPFGGHIHIRIDGQTWDIFGEANKIKFEQALWDRLGGTGSAEDIGPAQVQFALLPRAVAEAGRRLAVKVGERDVLIRF